MSDQTKYINAYVETAVSFTHEYLNTILQLKTQLKLTNDMIAEKDNIISQLSSKLESNISNNNELDQLRKQVQDLEAKNRGLANKASHIDTFARQISEMKRDMSLKNEEIASLKQELDLLKNPKTTIINRKKKPKPILSQVDEISSPSTLDVGLPITDDF